MWSFVRWLPCAALMAVSIYLHTPPTSPGGGFADYGVCAILGAAGSVVVWVLPLYNLTHDGGMSLGPIELTATKNGQTMGKAGQHIQYMRLDGKPFGLSNLLLGI